jgi:hypothetical protein
MQHHLSDAPRAGQRHFLSFFFARFSSRPACRPVPSPSCRESLAGTTSPFDDERLTAAGLDHRALGADAGNETGSACPATHPVPRSIHLEPRRPVGGRFMRAANLTYGERARIKTKVF